VPLPPLLDAPVAEAVVGPTPVVALVVDELLAAVPLLDVPLLWLELELTLAVVAVLPAAVDPTCELAVSELVPLFESLLQPTAGARQPSTSIAASEGRITSSRSLPRNDRRVHAARRDSTPRVAINCSA
jgi:hypothetical protein